MGNRLLVLLRWTAQAVGFLFVLSIISFLIVQLAPGDVVLSMLKIDTVAVTTDDIAALRDELGLNDPMLQQYLNYVGGLLRGDFGESMMTGAPVTQELAKAFPYTLLLAGWALIVTVALTFVLGGAAARFSGTWVDKAVSAFCLFGASIPTFWLGLILIDVFAVRLGIMPSSGLRDMRGIVLPTIALAVAIAPPYIKIMRGGLLDASRQDFIRAARSRGVAEWLVFAKHMLRDSLIPLVTILGVSLGGLLGGTIIVEITFGIPGVGKLAVEALARRDYAVIQAFIFVVGAAVFLINMLVDLSHRVLHPAISLKGAERA